MNYNFLIILLFFYLFNFSHIKANNIEIIGLDKLTIDDLKNLTEINLNEEFNDNKINLLLQDLYLSDLIYDVIVSKSNSGYNIQIIENKLIHNIYINGNEFIKNEQIIDLLKSKKGTLFNKNSITDDINLIKSIYASRGFKNSSIVVSTENFSKNRLNLIFTINEGNQYNISKISFFGNDNYSDKYLYSLINSKQQNFYNIFSSGSNLNQDLINFDKIKILNFYKKRGFFDAKINYEIIERNKNNLLNFYISEGERYLINEIDLFELNSFEIDKLDNLVDSFHKGIEKNSFYYDFDIVNDFLISLNSLLFLENITNKSISHEEFITQNKVNLSFVLKNNQSLTVNKIQINGNAITKDKTLRSKIFIEPGDFVNDNSIDKIKSDLTNLKYINSVNISKNIMDNKSDLLIDLSENKKTGNFILGGTFSGDTGLGFALGIKDLNLLGSGNEIDASLDLNSERTLFKINYKQYPYTNSNITNSYYFANQELDLTNSYGYKQKEREIGYSIGYLYNENLRLSSGINYINYEGYAGKNNNSFIKDNIGDFNNFLLKLSILSDKTNDILYPSKGTFNSLQFELSPTNISDDAYYKSRIKNDIYFSVKNTENFFFISNRAGIVQSLDDSKVKTGNTFSLGGLNFKGFDYRGIGPFSDNIYLGGNKFFTSTIGYGSSFLFDQKDNVYMKLFYTTGSLWDSDYSSNSNFELRSSLGLSFDILTPVGPISLSYATTIDKDSSDKNKSFNFSIGTSF